MASTRSRTMVLVMGVAAGLAVWLGVRMLTKTGGDPTWRAIGLLWLSGVGICAAGLWRWRTWALWLSWALASLILGLGLYGALVVWGPWLFRQPTWREALALALYPRNSLLIAMPLVWLGYFGRTAVRQRFRAGS